MSLGSGVGGTYYSKEELLMGSNIDMGRSAYRSYSEEVLSMGNSNSSNNIPPLRSAVQLQAVLTERQPACIRTIEITMCDIVNISHLIITNYAVELCWRVTRKLCHALVMVTTKSRTCFKQTHASDLYSCSSSLFLLF